MITPKKNEDFKEEWFDPEDQEFMESTIDNDAIETHDSFDHFVDDPLYADKYTTFSLEDY